jgi:hypothetical protein
MSLKEFLAAGKGRGMKRGKGEVKKKVRPVRRRTKKNKKTTNELYFKILISFI